MTRRPPDRARRNVLRTLLLPAGLSVGLPVGLSAGLLGGCTLNDAQRRDFHLLRDGDAGAVPAKLPPPVDQVLMLDIAAAPTLYDSDHMVFSADGSSRSYFQFAQWSERPSRTLMRLAETRLIAARHFRTVALSSSGVRGDLLLTLRLDELYLDDSRRPGAVHLAFSASLLDWRQRRLIARRSFASVVPAPSQNAAGTALAASQAVGQLLGELVVWAVESASPA